MAVYRCKRCNYLYIDDENEILEQAEDTLTIINKYIETMAEDVDKNKLQGLIKELYDEAALLRV